MILSKSTGAPPLLQHDELGQRRGDRAVELDQVLHLSDIKLPGGCFMPVVDRFKYLGSYLNRDCSDGLDVDSRIESAGRAFGALRKCLFSSRDVSFAAKRAVYTSLILSILLYGCECWALTERLLHRLRVFHAQCVRAMCRVTRKHVWEHHITTGELCARLGLDFAPG